MSADIPDLLADADRLQQVLWNLLSNAVKFTRRAGTVRVTAALVDSGIEIVVADDGEGIDREALPYIFDPFRQAEGGTTRHHGGLGLGLAIARRLIELHGGQLSASSAGPGLGAAFKVTLPIQARAATAADAGGSAVVRDAASPSSVTSAPLEGIRVLVVDDHDDTRELVTVVLEAAGAQVDMSDSASDALRRVEAERYDVVVSDIGMPGEDGSSLVAKLPREGRRPDRRLALIGSRPSRATATASERSEPASTRTPRSPSIREPWWSWSKRCWRKRARRSDGDSERGTALESLRAGKGVAHDEARERLVQRARR